MNWEAANRLVDGHVIYNVSFLIAGMMRDPDAACRMFNVDDEELARIAYRDPDVDDYRDAIPHGETLTVERAGVSWKWWRADASGASKESDGCTYDSELAAYESAFDELGWDRPDGAEIFEHWIVSDYLATRLEEHGERIARDVAGFTIWGRATTGQAIAGDAVIQRIAKELAA